MPIVLLMLFIFQIDLGRSRPLENPMDELGTHFTGRISRLSPVAKLMRIRTDFDNIKFLQHKDRVEFWNETYPDSRCISYVEGRTNDYLLLKVPFYDTCIRNVHFTTGSTLHFDSLDLAQNIKIARELIEILLKKRLAMQAKKVRLQKELTGHVEKVDAVNKRYEILRQKLEIEWQKELSLLEEDKAKAFTEFKNAEARVNEIDVKLEAYRVEDSNLNHDRWSLDPALYMQK